MILFEWDETKAKSNRRKHGVDFDEAVNVFLDEYALVELERVVDGEVRWQTIGRLGGETIVLVAHTVMEKGADEVVRRISARKTTPSERRRYGQNRTKDH